MDCKEWLRELIKGGIICDYKVITEAAQKKGYTKKELKRARQELRAITIHQRYPFETWQRYLPEDCGDELK